MPLPQFPFIIPLPGPVVEDDTRTNPFDRDIVRGRTAHLGYGLLRPFRRDEKNDFANAGDERLVRACVGQVLGTKCSSPRSQGELPWATDFGSLLYMLRHQPNNPALQELARYYVVDALTRWEPRVIVKDVSVTRATTPGQGENQLVIDLRYDIIAFNTPGNQVLVADVRQSVVV